MNDPIATLRNRHTLSEHGYGHEEEAFFDAPIHVEDLESSDNDPFHEEQAQPHRWLITTCIAGVAGSLVIGGALLGLFSDNSPSAQASVQLTEKWQRPTVSAKSDLNGEFTKALELRPYQEVSTNKNSGQNTTVISNSTILQQAPTAIQASLTFGPSSNSEKPTVLGNSGLLGNQNSFAPVPPSNTTTILKKLPPEPIDKTIVLKSGSTLISSLVELGVTNTTATQLAAALEPIFPSKLLKAGQKFIVTLDKQQDFFGNFVIYPVHLTFSPGPKEEISIEADDEGQFFVRVNGKKDKKPSRYAAPRSEQFRVAGRVTSSLFAAASDKGVPDYIINKVIRTFAHDVDFQRDVRAGAKFEIFFGKPFSGSSSRRKIVHYASLEVRGKTKRIYRYTSSRGKTGYYDSKGRGAAQFLMRTPVSGARISSGFGMRRHPVLGYSKMHTGIDFAAPRGTPIHAAGDGKIVWRSWKGGYGRVVEIKHLNGYLTRYAHMNAFAKGLSKGSFVRQGQVIGYVGSSGRTTGNHVHYEVRMNKRAVNPSRLRVVGKKRLNKRELARFNKSRQRIIALMKKSPQINRVASIAR